MGFNWGSEQCVKFARAYSITWIRNWIRPPEMCMGIHFIHYLVVCKAWVTLVGSNREKLPIDTSHTDVITLTHRSWRKREISPPPQKCVVHLLWSTFAKKKSYIQQLLNSLGLWLFLFCEFFSQLVNMCLVFLLHQQIWCGHISRQAAKWHRLSADLSTPDLLMQEKYKAHVFFFSAKVDHRRRTTHFWGDGEISFVMNDG